MALVPSAGGAYLPGQSQALTGNQSISGDLAVAGSATIVGDLTVTGTIADTGSSFASPAITGTVTGGASYTAPTLTAITVTGTSTIGTGMTITAPAIVGATITGTVTVAAGSTLTSPTLVTPALGTPASGVLSSCTAYALGALTGAGTGVLTALAANTGATGGFAVNGTAGVAAGYKVARSAAPVAVTGTLDIDTGLASVISVMVTASTDLDGDALAGVSGLITGAAGHFTAKCWKVTTGGAAGNPTMIAATAAKNVNWIAIGT